MNKQSTAKVLRDLKIHGLLSSWPTTFWKIGSIVGILVAALGMHTFVMSGAEEVPSAIFFQLWNLVLVNFGLEALSHEKNFHSEDKQPNLRMRVVEITSYALPLSCLFLGIRIFVPDLPDGATEFLVSTWIGSSILVTGAAEAYITRSLLRSKGEIRERNFNKVLRRMVRILMISLPFASATIAVNYYFGRPPGPASLWLVTLDANAKTLETRKIKELSDQSEKLDQRLSVLSDGSVALTMLQTNQNCRRGLGERSLGLERAVPSSEDQKSSWYICLPITRKKLLDWAVGPDGSVFILHKPTVIGREKAAILSRVSSGGTDYQGWSMAEYDLEVKGIPRALAVDAQSEVTVAFDLFWREKQSAVAIRKLRVDQNEETKVPQLFVDGELILAVNARGLLKRVQNAGQGKRNQPISVVPGLLRRVGEKVALGIKVNNKAMIARIRNFNGTGLGLGALDVGRLNDLVLTETGDIIYAGSSHDFNRQPPADLWSFVRRALAYRTDNRDESEKKGRKVTAWAMGRFTVNGKVKPFDVRATSPIDGAALKIVPMDRGRFMMAGFAENALGEKSKEDWCVRKFTKKGSESNISRAVLGGGGIDHLGDAIALGDGKTLIVGTGFGYSLSRDWRDIRL